MDKKRYIGWGIMSSVAFVGCAMGTALTGLMAVVAFGEAFKKEEK